MIYTFVFISFALFVICQDICHLQRIGGSTLLYREKKKTETRCVNEQKNMWKLADERHNYSMIGQFTLQTD